MKRSFLCKVRSRLSRIVSKDAVFRIGPRYDGCILVACQASPLNVSIPLSAVLVRSKHMCVDHATTLIKDRMLTMIDGEDRKYSMKWSMGTAGRSAINTPHPYIHTYMHTYTHN